MTEKKLANLINVLQRMINAQNWYLLDHFLKSYCHEEITDISIIAALRTTFAVRRKLDNWNMLLEYAKTRLPADTLRGLG